jgi:hypothetical protein
MGGLVASSSARSEQDQAEVQESPAERAARGGEKEEQQGRKETPQVRGDSVRSAQARGVFARSLV